jgi:calcium-binding protein CML
MLQRLGDDRSYEECVVMIDAFDIDHNGVLDFNEFHQMMV